MNARLADMLAQRTNTLVAQAVSRLRRDIPCYRTLPMEEIRGDVTRIVRRNFDLFVAAVRSGNPPAPADLAEIERSAADRAEEGVPLPEVLDAYHLAVELWWRAITELAPAAEGDLLAAVGLLVQQYLRRATGAVIAGYRADRPLRPDDAPDRMPAYRALTEGADAEDALRRAGLEPADRYWVVAIQVGAHADESIPGIDAAVAGHRKLRRLERELDRLAGGGTLYETTDHGGTALVPADAGGDLDGMLPGLARRLREVERVVAAPTVFATDCVRPERIPELLGQVRVLLRVALRHGRSSGVLHFRDLALEYQLAQPGPARAFVCEPLSPLLDEPTLHRTLVAYIDHECSSAATASALSVHPNTVLNRLRRISEVTGLNPDRPRDLLRMVAALTVDPTAEFAGPTA